MSEAHSCHALAEAGEEVVAISRRGGRDAPHVKHVVADVKQRTQIGDALKGAKAAFVMLSGMADDSDARAIVDTAKKSGIRKIVALSSIGTRSRPTAISHEPLRVLEEEVKRSDLAWTILQPGGFDSNAFAWIAGVRTQRTVAAPFGDVAIPLVDPADIGAVAAAALCDDRHAGHVYELTGPALVTPREQTKALADAIGAPLNFVELTRAQATEFLSAFMPPVIIETTLDAIGAPNDLERHVSADIEKVLGRAARPFAAWVLRNADAFR